MFDLKNEEIYFPEVVYLRECFKKGIEFNSFMEFYESYSSDGPSDFIVISGDEQKDEDARERLRQNFMNHYAIFKISTAK